MHQIHHTEAVIIKSEFKGESNKLFWFFTKEYGLLIALATGIRNQSAKLKGQLTDYAFVNIDLVEGRDIWRVINGSEIYNPITREKNADLKRSFVRILSTIERFLVGQEKNVDLYLHLKECGEFLSKNYEHLSYPKEKIIKNYDALSIWRIFIYLGYVAVDEKLSLFYKNSLKEAVFSLDENTRKEIITSVNKIILETHL